MKTNLLAASLAALLAVPLAAPAQAPGPEAAKKAPAKKPAASGGSVATVNGVPVPRARLDAMVQQQQARGAPDNEQMRAAVRENLINREVVAQEAARAGLAKLPVVQNQIDLARQQILIDAYISEWVRKNPITDADIEKEYERVKASQGSKEYKARHILVESEDQAKGLITDLKKGAKFDDLAQKHTKDTGTKERGGDLDWNVPSVFDKQFADAMVGLEKGKYTEAPVRTRFGYHIIQLDDVRETKFPSLAEAKPRIQQSLVQRKVDEMVKGLRAKAKVE
ncbi:MAG TPA: peptidylprolyl isomerase [Burkholderiales bacterium]|nr:peptidylprolyl isomerase [Burkholderiales bacterium]